MGESKVEIGIATLDKVPQILLLIHAYMKEHEGIELSEKDKDALRINIINSILDNSVNIIIASVKGRKGKQKIIGCGVLDIKYSIIGKPIAWGYLIYVHPTFRGRNIHKNMIEYAEEKAKETGAQEFYIDINHPHVFENMGYKRISTVMRKGLIGG